MEQTFFAKKSKFCVGRGRAAANNRGVARGGFQGFRNPPPPPSPIFTAILSQQECNGLAIPEMLRFVLSLQLVIVFTAGPAFEDLFNTCISFLLDINTVHTNVNKETIEYLLKLTSK